MAAKTAAVHPMSTVHITSHDRLGTDPPDIPMMPAFFSPQPAHDQNILTSLSPKQDIITPAPPEPQPVPPTHGHQTQSAAKLTTTDMVPPATPIQPCEVPSIVEPPSDVPIEVKMKPNIELPFIEDSFPSIPLTSCTLSPSKHLKNVL